MERMSLLTNPVSNKRKNTSYYYLSFFSLSNVKYLNFQHFGVLVLSEKYLCDMKEILNIKSVRVCCYCQQKSEIFPCAISHEEKK